MNAGEQRTVLVWDLPVRRFHALPAVGFIGAGVTAESDRAVVFVHLAVASRSHRENPVRAIVTGRKADSADAAIRSAWRSVGMRLLGVPGFRAWQPTGAP